jgi:Predicted transcriptional regulator
MKSPFTGKEMKVRKEWRTMSFRKEDFEVYFHTYQCEDTGEQFEDEAFAALNYNQLINQYRSKYNIPFPAEIKAIREMYDLSASKMSEILGLGANSYRNYESGEVPNQSNARLIQLAADPHEFKKLVEIGNVLEGAQLKKIEHRIESCMQEQKATKATLYIERFLFGKLHADSQTGFVKPNLAKLSEMAVFFSERLQPWKTKLNKLLFYADFTHYRNTGYSISGTPYRAIQMGPVPNNFQSLFEYFVNLGAVGIHTVSFDDGGLGEQFLPKAGRPFDNSLFSEDELTVLHAIAERFKDTSTRDIIALSHQEKAWIENQQEHNVIDYRYGFELLNG